MSTSSRHCSHLMSLTLPFPQQIQGYKAILYKYNCAEALSITGAIQERNYPRL